MFTLSKQNRTITTTIGTGISTRVGTSPRNRTTMYSPTSTHGTLTTTIGTGISTRVGTSPRNRTTMYSPTSTHGTITTSPESRLPQPPSYISQEVTANGQVWAILGCVLTIGNIIAAVGFYLFRRRKKRLRKQKKDGAGIECGNVPSDSHYTLPNNPDPHYHQIMINPEGLPVDSSDYLTVIERFSGKSSGYMEMSNFSSSQRSNSYQEISDYRNDIFTPLSHSNLQVTRSLGWNWSEQGLSENSADIATKRIQKKRDNYLVTIDIPSFSTPGEDDDTNDIRKSCVLSPELMDDGLFESLNDFARYFTTLSVKRRQQLELANERRNSEEQPDDTANETKNDHNTENTEVGTEETRKLQINGNDTKEKFDQIEEGNISKIPLGTIDIQKEIKQNAQHHFGSIEEQGDSCIELTQEVHIPTQTDTEHHQADQIKKEGYRKFEQLPATCFIPTQQYSPLETIQSYYTAMKDA